MRKSHVHEESDILDADSEIDDGIAEYYETEYDPEEKE